MSFRVSPQQCEASSRIVEKVRAEFDERAHYYCDLERKYSRAKQLIVKLQKECETLKREADGKHPMINDSI